MIYLLLSILLNALIFIFFKLAGRLRVSNIAVIVLNYMVAGFTALLFSKQNSEVSISTSSWFIPAVLLGCTFIGVFYITARATQKAGAAAASVANKMSLIIPVTIAFFLFGEAVTFWKITGICLAIPGIILAASSAGNGASKGPRGIWLLLLVFAGSGMIDSFLNIFQVIYLTGRDVIPFTAVLFLTAFTSGLVILIVRFRHFRNTFSLKAVLAGTGLGLVNFGSVYFLIRALQSEGMQSSVLFPLNNIGVVALSSVLSAILFGEKLGRKKIAGLAICIMALVLLMLEK